MLRKTLLAALAAAALAVPAAATAEWKEHQTPIQTEQPVQLTGNYIVDAGGLGIGSINCQVKIDLRLKPGTTGEMITFAVDLDQAGSTVTSKCGTGGGLSLCQVHAMQGKGGPWSIHDQTAAIQVKQEAIEYSITGAMCMYKKIQLTPTTITATPKNQPNTIAELQVSGTGEAHAEKLNGQQITTNMTVSGVWTIIIGANTYSL